MNEVGRVKVYMWAVGFRVNRRVCVVVEVIYFYMGNILIFK